MPTMIEDIVCHFHPDQRGSRVTTLPKPNKNLIVENEILMLVERFGFTEEGARSIVQYNKYLKDIEYLKWIPRSLLVQTFMRKLQNGMDRRRP